VTSDQDIGERQSWRGVSVRGDIGATALAVEVTSDGDIGEQEAPCGSVVVGSGADGLVASDRLQ
jgi:hypothetical protein